VIAPRALGALDPGLVSAGLVLGKRLERGDSASIRGIEYDVTPSGRCGAVPGLHLGVQLDERVRNRNRRIEVLIPEVA
jgi:hypothetical protein